MIIEASFMKTGKVVVPPAPAGGVTLHWVGPAVIWMVSSIATGELIFTPRVASLYGYTVIWMVAVAIFLKALIAHEIGRYAVVTGRSFLRGASGLPGPKNWGVLLIILPQFVLVMPEPLMFILMLVAALFYIFFAFYYIHTIVS